MDVDYTDSTILEEITVVLSETGLKTLKVKNRFKQKCLKMIGMGGEMSQKYFEEEVMEVYECCLRGISDLYELHLRRKKGLELLEDIAQRAKPEYFTIKHVIHVMWSMMSCIHHFRLRVMIDSSKLLNWSRKKQAARCMTLFTNIIKLFPVSMHRIALNSMLVFYKKGKMWDVEFGMSFLVTNLFELKHVADEGITDLIVNIEEAVDRDKVEAKYLMQILYKVIEKTRWSILPHSIFMRLLDIFESSIRPKEDDLFDYSMLKMVMENGLISIIKKMEVKELIDIMYIFTKKVEVYCDDEVMLLHLSRLVIFASHHYKLKTNKIYIYQGPLPIIFKLFNHKNPTVLLIALKVWQNLVNKGADVDLFSSPYIYYRDCEYNIIIKSCDPAEKEFFKTIKRIMYKMSMICLIICDDKIGLDNTFEAIALTLVNIRCAITAFCFVTVAMDLQDYAFELSTIDFIRSHHLHATVISILSLVCYLHKANVLYDYVSKIMEKRGQWAPHLNPPLRIHYDYAEHHVLWNSADLFFEDWEVRYGLWKCFRGKNLDEFREDKQYPVNKSIWNKLVIE